MNNLLKIDRIEESLIFKKYRISSIFHHKNYKIFWCVVYERHISVCNTEALIMEYNS